VGDGAGQYFTRNGALNLDANGNLVNAAGLTVMGWNQVDIDPTTGRRTVIPGVVEPIRIGPEKEFVAPTATTTVDLTGNLNAMRNTAQPKVMSMTIYDSVGNRYVIDVEMQYVKRGGLDTAPVVAPALPNPAQDGWITSVRPIAFPGGDRTKGVMLNVEANGEITFLPNAPINRDAAAEPVGQMIFDTNGLPVVFLPNGANADLIVDPDSGLVTGVERVFIGATATPANTVAESRWLQMLLSIDPEIDPLPSSTPSLNPGATFGSDRQLFADEDEDFIQNAIALDFSKLTQFGERTSDAITTMRDGNAPGVLNGISIGTDGTIIGRYSNGEVRPLAQIPVAFFKNPAGMEKIGDSLYVPTGNSGEFNGTGDAITAKGGSLLGGVLEMSNVDLSNEFVEMITTQRGFQANSRIISTSDEMLMELVNLKR
jgi:flagellar hook protein FlgE